MQKHQELPVVLALDTNNLRQGYALLHSILEQARPEAGVFYQFFILYEKLHPKLVEFGETLFNTRYSSLRFVKLKEEALKLPVEEESLRPLYYKLYIPLLFADYEHVLYLDSAMIARADISRIFEQVPDSVPLAATRDSLHRIARAKEQHSPASFGKMTQDDYDRNLLKLQNPDDYFQDGVLIFNIKQIDKAHYQHFAGLLETPLWHHAQDILNLLFQGQVGFLEERWNFPLVPSAFRPCPQNSLFLPEPWRKALEKAENCPGLLHYHGMPDLLNDPEREGAALALTHLDKIDKSFAALEETDPQNAKRAKQAIETFRQKIKPEIIYEDEFPIVISFDDIYALYGMTVLQSVLETAASGQKFAFFVLYDKLSEEMRGKMTRFFETSHARLVFIAMTPLLEGLDLPLRWHWSSSIYNRLFIPLLFEGNRMLVYLDSDIVVRKDITTIINFMDGSKALGAVRDLIRLGECRSAAFYAPQGCVSRYGESWAGLYTRSYNRFALGLKNPDEQYFQSGILLFNMMQISAEDVWQCLELCPQNLWAPDQDILNIVFRDRVCFLDERWNTFSTSHAVERIMLLPQD